MQLLVASGYYVLENDICFNLPDARSGKPDCAKSGMVTWTDLEWVYHGCLDAFVFVLCNH